MESAKIISLVPPQKVSQNHAERGGKCILDLISLLQAPPTGCVWCGCALVLSLPIPHIRWLLPIFGKLLQFFSFVAKTAAPECDSKFSPNLGNVGKIPNIALN